MDFKSNYYRRSFEAYPKNFTKTNKRILGEREKQNDEPEIVEEYILNEDSDQDNDFQDDEEVLEEEFEINKMPENYFSYNNYIHDGNGHLKEVNVNNNLDNQVQDEVIEFPNGEISPEVPLPTSGSFDCSSIGSIPWADDAINRNKQQWENIEQMLNGLEPLPNDQELSKEISDWQQKFPQIFRKYVNHRHHNDSKYSPSVNGHRILSSRKKVEANYREKSSGNNVQQLIARLERQSLKDSPWKVANSVKDIAEMSDRQLKEFLKQIGIVTVPRYTQHQSLRPVIQSYRSYQNGKGISQETPLYKAFSPPRTASPLRRASLTRRIPRMPPIITEMPNVTTTAPPHPQRKHRSFVLLGQVKESAFNNPRDYRTASRRSSLIQQRQYNSFVLPAISHKRLQQPQANGVSAYSNRVKHENSHIRALKLREPMNSSGSSSISSESQRSSTANIQYQRKQRLQPSRITNSLLTYRGDMPLKLNINK